MTKGFVYVLCNSAPWPRHYVGVTEDVARRLTDHNEGRCSHTAKYRPWRQHVVIEFSTERAAIAFECYLKSGSGRVFAKAPLRLARGVLAGRLPIAHEAPMGRATPLHFDKELGIGVGGACLVGEHLYGAIPAGWALGQIGPIAAG